MNKAPRKPEELREILTQYLDYLMGRTHIECRSTLAKYRLKLQIDQYLNQKEMNTIIKFLVRDSDHSKRELRKIFSPIIRSSKHKNDETRIDTLDAFLID